MTLDMNIKVDPQRPQLDTAPIKPEFVLPKITVAAALPEDTTTINDQGKEQPPADKKRGQNKKRQFEYNDSKEYDLCNKMAFNLNCEGQNCKGGHDLDEYLRSRAEDIGDVCPNYETFGQCKYGIKCRFHKQHTDPETKKQLNKKVNEEVLEQSKTANVVERDLLSKLRQRQYKFDRYDQLPKFMHNKDGTQEQILEYIGAIDLEAQHGGKRIDFAGKTYLAPLTTVGNLPFRRLCKDFGVDITCSEMAMSDQLLKGSPSEWALLKRHASEDLYGIQICGGHADVLARSVEVICKELEVDFIDINQGCPIDLVFQKQQGSGMFSRPNKMFKSLACISAVSTVPVTAKFRTGIYSDKNTAHKYLDMYSKLGYSLCTMHGRSRQQRYSRLADWDYIDQVAREAKADYGLQFFGNGDVLSYEEYQHRLDTTNADGVMIGRGALVKPWIFTEIKERRIWDISASERFDMMKKFAEYGLTHYGSDTQGVNKTRRFMLEFQSFHCRYIPVGLMEVLPQKMNEKPPRFCGRNELETLMASDHAADWIKLTEMILGKANEDFVFVPKHKSAAY
ncbi:hypothetical protein MIR68_003585 [Amoeboaphelidium protococcarum]|nr:hypothetical protein MIR68_003585 [Amoeboaphelidium protococcarum]